jgi:hypothetical protein
MATVKLEQFNTNYLEIPSLIMTIEPDILSLLPYKIYDDMKDYYRHIYYLGTNKKYEYKKYQNHPKTKENTHPFYSIRKIREEIQNEQMFDPSHYSFQLSAFSEQLRSTTPTKESKSLLIIHGTNQILKTLSRTPSFINIINNVSDYNLTIYIITHTFPEVNTELNELMQKYLTYCIMGEIKEDRYDQMIRFIGQIFDPPQLYLQIYNIINEQGNHIIIHWDNPSTELHKRIYWYNKSYINEILKPIEKKEREEEYQQEQLIDNQQSKEQIIENYNINNNNENINIENNNIIKRNNENQSNIIKKIYRKMGAIEDMILELKGLLNMLE